MEDNFTAKFFSFVLNTAGIPNEWQKGQLEGKLITIWKYYLLYSFTLLTTSQLLALRNNETPYELCMSLIFILNAIFLNITVVVRHIKKESIFEMLKIFNTDFVFISEQTGIPQITNKRFKEFILSFGVSYCVIYVVVISSPFLFFPISSNKLGDTNTLLIPCWFPWTIDTYTKYILTIALQFSWLGALSIPILTGFLFTTYFIIEVKCQVEVLSKVVMKWKSENMRNADERRMHLEFKMFIRYHQVIWRFIRCFCACYSWVFAANLIYSAANLTLIFFAIRSGERTVPAVMQQCALFIMVFFYLFLYCFIGEMLCEVNEKVKTILYDTDWFKHSTGFRKMFTIFMCIIQRDLNLKTGITYVASFELFSKILKMSYSYFNIMSKAF